MSPKQESLRREAVDRFTHWAPGKQVLAAIRSYQAHKAPLLVKKLAVLRHRFWSAIAGCDIPINARIGPGLNMPHPNGIVIHPEAYVGWNCTIFQQVTIGTKGTADGVPEIGNNVEISAGAKILGPVKIGDWALIGTNAIVTKDVLPGATVVGVNRHLNGFAFVHPPYAPQLRRVRD
jgi:serine O-acetyltransferase